MDTVDDLVDQIEPLVKRLWPVVSAELAGKAPQVQGAVLADLTAIWLAGHIGPDKEKVRRFLLRAQIRMIKMLIEPNEQMILAGFKPAGRA